MSGGALVVTGVVGAAGDPALAERLHALAHDGRLEVVALPAADAARRRMRVRTDRGRDVAIALDRAERLSDGAVLHLTDDLAIVARLDGGARLRLTPRDVASALRVGYWVGNLHWRVAFAEDAIEVILEAPEESYRARLADLADHARFDAERMG